MEGNVLTLSVTEAARRLGIGRNLCYEAIRRGEIPVVRIGSKRLLVPVIALDQLLAGNSDGPKGDQSG